MPEVAIKRIFDSEPWTDFGIRKATKTPGRSLSRSPQTPLSAAIDDWNGHPIREGCIQETDFVDAQAPFQELICVSIRCFRSRLLPAYNRRFRSGPHKWKRVRGIFLYECRSARRPGQSQWLERLGGRDR